MLGRFLQTDPIGYKDQVNLYAYVGDDPVDGRDPTGTKCEGEGKDTKCTFDSTDPEGGKVSKIQQGDIHAYERQYTNTVKQLESHPDKTVPISYGGKVYKVRAGDVAATLRSREFVAKPNGSFVAGTTADGRKTYVGAVGLAGKGNPSDERDHDRRITTVHEGIHRGPSEAAHFRTEEIQRYKDTGTIVITTKPRRGYSSRESR